MSSTTTLEVSRPTSEIDVELSTFDDRPNSDHIDYHSLPRADGGRQAWTFLVACFMLEAIVWGFPFSFGIFQAYYSQHELFSSQAGSIASIGTTATGVMYFLAPPVAIFAQRWPRLRRPGMAIGVGLMVISLIAASFCNTVTGLIATEGVLYAIGGLFAYYPSIQFIDEWFISRKGVAYGVMWAGSGFAGVITPFILQWLLDSYGFRTALRVWAVVLAVTLTPALFVVRGRLPFTSSNALRPVDLSFLKSSPFWVFLTSIIAQGIGYFIPSLWIPTFANSLRLPTFAGPLAIALYSLAACFGSIFLGAIVDKMHVTTAMLIATIGQVIAVFVFWGCTTSQPMLYTFAIIWGVFGGGSSGTWSGCPAAIQRWEGSEGRNIDAGMIIALLAAGKGVGAVASGPLSEKLIEVGGKWHAGLAYGSGYGILIVFTGVSATLGASAFLGRRLKLV